MTYFHRCIVFVTLITFCTAAKGQRLDHVLGEALVEIQKNRTGHQVAQDLQKTYGYSEGISARQIMTQPLNIWVLAINPHKYDEELFRSQLTHHSTVLTCQKNHITQLRTTPNDPLFNSQWQYINTGVNGGILNADLDMDLAWDISTGGLTVDGDTIVVCIVDDGANIAHPDLAANVWINHLEIPNNGLDDDENGYIDDYQGWNAYNSTDNVTDDGSHGTSVAGIVAAVGDNEEGVSGVNWQAKTMIVEGGSPESTAIEAYGYAYNQRRIYNETNGAKGAFVVATNSSWGINNGQASDAPIWCGFYDILGEVGILSAGATANRAVNVDTDGDLPTTCPSDFLLAVTNIERSDSKRVSAGYGLRNIDLGAYGEETYTIDRVGYGEFGGTSAATPHVAGVIALAYSTGCEAFMAQVRSNPMLAARAVKDHILLGTTENNSLSGISVTEGRLNAHTTLLNTVAICEQDCSEAFGMHMSDIGIFESTAAYLDAANTGEARIRYRRSDANAWIEVISNTGTALLSNLTDCAEYEYQSATVCNGTMSDYSYSKYFTTAGCCEAPANIDIQIENTIATIRWENTIDANRYIVEYREIGGEDWKTVPAAGGTEILIGGIRPCKVYEVRIQSICDVVNRESSPVIRQFFGNCGTCTEAYCEIGPKDTSDEWIELVAIDDVFENVSGDDNGAGLFFGSLDINLTIGKTYTLRMEPGYTAGAFSEYFSAYIDFDQDVSFSDQEAIYDSNIGTSTAVSGTFTVPQDAVIGTTRMRILMRFGESNQEGCDDEGWSFGEYEEYCVNIVETQECPTSITGLANIDSAATSLIFTMPSFFDSYEVDYRVQGSTDFLTAVSVDKDIELVDLDECTFYDIRPRGICEDGSIVETDNLLQLKTKCTTATEEIDSREINLYPNPSIDRLNISIPDLLTVDKVDIFASTGQLAFNKRDIAAVKGVVALDTLENLPAGLYFVVIHTNSSQYTRKWIKL